MEDRSNFLNLLKCIVNILVLLESHKSSFGAPIGSLIGAHSELIKTFEGGCSGPSLERVQRVHSHPSISGNGC